MSFWLDDLDIFFDDFSCDVTLKNYPSSSGTSGTTSGMTSDVIIKGLFDEAQKIVDIEAGQVISAKPSVMVKTSDVTNLVRRAKVIINLVEYFVNDILDDGTGATILQLSER